MSGVSGKSAIVTGAASGIGSALVEQLAAQGARVVVADIDDRAGIAITESLRNRGFIAEFEHVDVANRDSCRRLAVKAREVFGGIDILCANAGVYPFATLMEMTEAEWDRVHSINLKGGFLSVQACLEAMRDQSYGRIVLTSSITGSITGYPGFAHYAATKAGLLGFMRTAAVELAPHGITVNAVLPGNVSTAGVASDPEYLREMASHIPTGRLAEPEEIAHAALFFASEESGYITGQTLVVDGGQVLPESPAKKPM